MNNAAIPDVSFQSKSAGMTVDFKLKNMMFQRLEIDTIWITTIENTGFSAGIDNGVAIINFDWSYEMLSYPFNSDRGNGQMEINDFYGSCIITVKLEDNASKTEINDMYVDIGSFNLDITSSGLMGGILTMIIDLMSPFLTDYIGEIMTDMFVTAAGEIANADSGDYIKTVDDDVDLVWMFINGMSFESNAGVNFIKILYKPKDYEIEDVPYEPSPMPTKISNEPLQFLFDLTIFDSAWFTYMTIGYFNEVFDSSILSGDPLTIGDLRPFIPEITKFYPENYPLELVLNCDKLVYSKVLFTGTFRDVHCTIVFNVMLGGENSIGDPLLSISGQVGVAEQSKLFDNEKKLGLKFFYHSNEYEAMEILSQNMDKDISVETKELLAYCTRMFVVPYLNEWGEHISFVHFLSVGLRPEKVTMRLESSYVALGYEPALDI